MIAAMTMERLTGEICVTRTDGYQLRGPLDPTTFSESSMLAAIGWSPVLNELLAVTLKGDEIVFETPTPYDTDRLSGRLVVYLDQNQWRPIANTFHGSGDVHPEDATAANRLVELVEARKVVLPASSGHYTEATKWSDGDRRYALGLTILKLSRGWQMLDPLEVRRIELSRAMANGYSHARPRETAEVFTLMPHALNGNRETRTPPSQVIAQLPPDFRFAHQLLTYASAQIDVMLDREHIEAVAPIGWAAHNQRFSDWLDGEDRTTHAKRASIDALLLADLSTEIAEEAHACGLKPEEMSSWFRGRATDDIGAATSLGPFRAMLHTRHLKRGIRWWPNDLIDMLYLSCAAGYADFVICERKMAGVLHEGLRTTGAEQRIFRRLRDALPAIEAKLNGEASPA